jgi:carbonic anhydrase
MKYTAEQTLAILVEGNRKFSSGKIAVQSFQDAQQIMQADQKPIAVILSCADSRVLPEQIFSQGIGDIFVIRVAGNIATPAQIGSIEYAVKQYEIPLVVILGHSNCGAISATINALRDPSKVLPENLQHIVDDIKPTVIDVYQNNQDAELETLERLAVKENAVNIVSELCDDSEFLNTRVQSGDLKIVAAKFDMDTALVEFFD